MTVQSEKKKRSWWNDEVHEVQVHDEGSERELVAQCYIVHLAVILVLDDVDTPECLPVLRGTSAPVEIVRVGVLKSGGTGEGENWNETCWSGA